MASHIMVNGETDLDPNIERSVTDPDKDKLHFNPTASSVNQPPTGNYQASGWESTQPTGWAYPQPGVEYSHNTAGVTYPPSQWDDQTLGEGNTQSAGWVYPQPGVEAFSGGYNSASGYDLQMIEDVAEKSPRTGLPNWKWKLTIVCLCLLSMGYGKSPLKTLHNCLFDSNSAKHRACARLRYKQHGQYPSIYVPGFGTY